MEVCSAHFQYSGNHYRTLEPRYCEDIIMNGQPLVLRGNMRRTWEDTRRPASVGIGSAGDPYRRDGDDAVGRDALRGSGGWRASVSRWWGGHEDDSWEEGCSGASEAGQTKHHRSWRRRRRDGCTVGRRRRVFRKASVDAFQLGAQILLKNSFSSEKCLIFAYRYGDFNSILYRTNL